MGMSCIMESNFGKSQHFDLSIENSPDIAFVCRSAEFRTNDQIQVMLQIRFTFLFYSLLMHFQI